MALKVFYPPREPQTILFPRANTYEEEYTANQGLRKHICHLFCFTNFVKTRMSKKCFFASLPHWVAVTGLRVGVMGGTGPEDVDVSGEGWVGLVPPSALPELLDVDFVIHS